MTMSEDNAATSSIKEILSHSLGQLGVGAVLAVLLLLYYYSESRRWDARMVEENRRWEALFSEYQQNNKDALKTIEACCNDRLRRLEDIEASDRRRR